MLYYYNDDDYDDNNIINYYDIMLMTRITMLQGRGRKRGVNKGRDGLGWSSVDHGNPEVSFQYILY